MSRRLSWSTLALALMPGLVLAGCATEPAALAVPGNGNPPVPTSFPTSFPTSWQESLVAPPAPTRDPLLDRILAEAGTGLDVAILGARVREAEALLRATRAGQLLPSVTTSASADSRSGDSGLEGSSTTAGLSAAIPLDLFGAGRARTGAARARAEAARLERARMVLVARRTAGALYTSVRVGQEQLAIARRTLAAANDSLALARARQQAGLETGLGVAQATSARDVAAARLPGLEQSTRAGRLALEALLNRTPGALEAEFAAPAAIPWPELGSAMPAPEVWLARRPDIAAAEAQARAAGLDARAARRDRLPQLSLTLTSSSLTGDALMAGQVSGGAVAIAATLLDFGRLEGLARANGARAEAAALLYRQAVVQGLTEVETQAGAVRRADAAVMALDAAVASASDQARLARVRYTSGLSSFLDVLVADQALYEAESARTTARAERATAAFALIAALGS
jgi:outer membrane protein, multidrug efflux system